MDPSSVRRRSSVGREPGWKTSGRNICAAQPAFSSRRTRFASGWLAKRSKSCAGESTAVADAVRRELEEGMSRLEEIPVPDMQTLDSYSGYAGPSGTEEQREIFRSGADYPERRAAPGRGRTKAVRQEVGGETQQAYPILQRLDRPTASGVIGFDFDGEIQELRGQLFWLARNLKEGCIPGQKRMRALSEKGSRELEAYASDPNLHSRREQAKLFSGEAAE